MRGAHGVGLRGLRGGHERRSGRQIRGGTAPVMLLALACAACAGRHPVADAGPAAGETGAAGEPLRTRVFYAAEVQERPELIGCRYEAPPGSPRWVRLRYVVDASGHVEDVSIVPVDRDPRATARHEEQAVAIASSCRYRPGRIAGEAVRVQVEETFRFR